MKFLKPGTPFANLRGFFAGIFISTSIIISSNLTSDIMDYKPKEKKSKEWTDKDYEDYYNKQEKTCFYCRKSVTGSLYSRSFGETYKLKPSEKHGYCSPKCARENSRY